MILWASIVNNVNKRRFLEGVHECKVGVGCRWSKTICQNDFSISSLESSWHLRRTVRQKLESWKVQQKNRRHVIVSLKICENRERLENIMPRKIYFLQFSSLIRSLELLKRDDCPEFSWKGKESCRSWTAPWPIRLFNYTLYSI